MGLPLSGSEQDMGIVQGAEEIWQGDLEIGRARSGLIGMQYAAGRVPAFVDRKPLQVDNVQAGVETIDGVMAEASGEIASDP